MNVGRLRHRPCAGHGFTLLELVVVIAVVCFTLSVVLDRLLYQLEMAEKAAMEQTVAILRTSLQLQTASLIARGRPQDMSHFADQNPMDWLSEKPKNYFGEVEGLPDETVVSGHWFFDKKEKILIYVVHNGRHFRTGNNYSKQVIFRVKLLYRKTTATGDERPSLEGVMLEQVSPYSWFR